MTRFFFNGQEYNIEVPKEGAITIELIGESKEEQEAYERGVKAGQGIDYASCSSFDSPASCLAHQEKVYIERLHDIAKMQASAAFKAKQRAYLEGRYDGEREVLRRLIEEQGKG